MSTPDSAAEPVATDIGAPGNAFYRSYVSYKGWSGRTGAGRDPEFDAILASAARGEGSLRILELGFGEGEFLRWAASAGHRVYGIELIPELCERAAKNGFAVTCGASVGEAFPGVEFDVCVAIDVFEHLTVAQLGILYQQLGGRLAPGGRLVARFPNGNSPLSLRFQNGDATHEHYLTPEKLRQIAAEGGFRLVRSGNLRPKAKGLVNGLRRRLVYAARDSIELVVGLLYYGYRVPLDPNSLVVLERQA